MLSPFASEVRQIIHEKLPGLAPKLSETPAGELILTVPHPVIPSGLRAETQGSDFTIGFAVWHTHADVEGGVVAAVDLLGRILADEVTLVVLERSGQFEDAWVTQDPERERKYQQPDETLRIGSWSELAV